MPFVAQPQEKCTACGRNVFATEKIVVEDKEVKKPYHKTCIRCQTCNQSLSLGNYSALDGLFYCKPHFKQLFATKGNYDEAFGKEKLTSKWEPTVNVVTPGQGSFVPATSDEKPIEKNQTSEATLAKFKKFREEGETEKCFSCEKPVYFTEKLIVEEVGNKRVYHKNCLRCSEERCGKQLDLGSYASIDSVIYCKPHYKQLFATKGNYDEAFGKEKPDKWQPTVVTGPVSFVPATSDDKPTEKNQTSEATLAKFRKFREEGESNKCEACDKTVYLAEKLLVEDKDGKRLFHKACFKCSLCDVILDLRNYGSEKGKIYCKNHLKEVQAQNLKSSYVGSAPTSFVPESNEDKKSEKGETPEHIAAKFKGLGMGGDKCKSCGKTVYATEKIIVEELNGNSIFHKNCLRCSHCDIKLDLSTYGSAGGVIYCKVHLKSVAAPEIAKVAIDPDNPLTSLRRVDNVSKPNLVPVNSSQAEGEEDNERESQPRSHHQEQSQEQEEDDREEEEEREVHQEREEEKQAATPVSASPAPERRQEELKEEERSRPSSTRSTPRSSPAPERRQPADDDDSEEAQKRRRDQERRRQKEERERQLEEEERQAERERQKKKEERERRLRESSEPAVTEVSTSADTSADNEEEERLKREKEREDRRKQREEQERQEEEERQRKLEERKREREARRKQQEEEEAKEEEERQKRNEERKKRLESLKGEN